MTILVNGYEGDTPLMYYDYSIDGGKSYSKLYPWPDSDILHNEYDDYFALTLHIPEQTRPEIVLRAYNKFDIYQQSNILSGFDTFQTVIDEPFVESIPAENDDSMSDSQQVNAEQTNMDEITEIKTKRFWLFAAFIMLWVLLLAAIVYVIYRFFGKEKKHHK